MTVFFIDANTKAPYIAQIDDDTNIQEWFTEHGYQPASYSISGALHLLEKNGTPHHLLIEAVDLPNLTTSIWCAEHEECKAIVKKYGKKTSKGLKITLGVPITVLCYVEEEPFDVVMREVMLDEHGTLIFIGNPKDAFAQDEKYFAEEIVDGHMSYIIEQIIFDNTPDEK